MYAAPASTTGALEGDGAGTGGRSVGGGPAVRRGADDAECAFTEPGGVVAGAGDGRGVGDGLGVGVDIGVGVGVGEGLGVGVGVGFGAGVGVAVGGGEASAI